MSPVSRNVNEQVEASLTRSDKVALWLTNQLGHFASFTIILLWTTLWLGWNSLGPEALRFDAFPTFAVWLFISNLIQLHFMPLLSIGQRLLGRHAEYRAEQDHKINLHLEGELEEIQTQLALVLEELEELAQR